MPLQEVSAENPRRLRLAEVECGIDYALIINSNAGLWGYSIGDTVSFISLNPYRLKVTGRVKHFISAFGEHVIGKEVEAAMKEVTAQFGLRTVEFTVAPQVTSSGRRSALPRVVCRVCYPTGGSDSCGTRIGQSDGRAKYLLRRSHQGSDLTATCAHPTAAGCIPGVYEKRGKLGGQNKVPRLSNDRKIADALGPWRMAGNDVRIILIVLLWRYTSQTR